ncbi:sodium/solute symporter [uncultured Prevotella sp.]|uniref:sodium:solute symporter family transporter n=1 Tax=uncultured Prevotella sp. TaxID=159272 RepID=UPI00258312E7|nr:sodium/solute symporter [uncultured Prevotella sp.]
MDKIIQALSNNGFAWQDYMVFVIYIIILVGMGLFLSRTKKGEEKSSTDYFLAGNTLTWWAVGASLIAANISAEQFIGMSGSAFASGIAPAAYELMAAATLLVVGKYLLPLMIEKKIFTIPQFLRERYNWGVGFAFSLLWLFLYVFVNLTSVAWLGALAIQQILGLPTDMTIMVAGMEIDQVRMVIILSLFIIAGVYSIYGGLASVALVGGGLITAYAALSFIGGEMGIGGAWDTLVHIKDYLAQDPADTHFNLVVTRNAEAYPVVQDDPFFTNPGIVLIFGALWLTNLGYWGFNQYIIQKGLAAKSLDEAKKGMVFAAFLKILIPFIVCIPGVCAFYIMNAPECADLRATLAGSIGRSDDAYPFLIRNFTPTVVKGLSFAALAAAVISSLASMFNSKQFINKTASEKKLVTVGRLTSVCALIIALIAVYPLMGGIDQAFQFIQEYSAFVYPGVVVIFGLGLLWKRASGTAAVVCAIGTFAFSIIYKFAFPDMPFLVRSGVVFITLVILFVWISLKSKKSVPADQLDEHTVKTQLFWSHVMFIVAAISLALCIGGFFNETMHMLGFEGAMIFFAAITGTIGIYLRSNALDKVQDPKLVAIDLKVFKTDRIFDFGAFGVIAILTILYIALW